MLDLEEIKKLPPAERIEKLKELEEQMEKEKELAKSMINDSISEIEKKQEIEVIIESERRARKREQKKEEDESLDESVEEDEVRKEVLEDNRDYELRIKTNIPGAYEMNGSEVVDEIRRLTYQQSGWTDQDTAIYNQIKEGLATIESYTNLPQAVTESLDEARKAMKAMGYKRVRR